jgi:hypothetical protein
VPQPGQVAADLLDAGQQRALADERDRLRVGEHVPQLGGDVAVVHRDRHGADLEDAEHGLDPLGAVVRQDRHVLAGTHARRGEVVPHPVGPFAQLAVGAALLPGHQGRAVRSRLGKEFEQIGQVVAAPHGRSSRLGGGRVHPILLGGARRLKGC